VEYVSLRVGPNQPRALWVTTVFVTHSADEAAAPGPGGAVSAGRRVSSRAAWEYVFNARVKSVVRWAQCRVQGGRIPMGAALFGDAKKSVGDVIEELKAL
jgi:hypothetical protein